MQHALFYCLFLAATQLAVGQTGKISYYAIINRSQPGTPIEDMKNDDLYAQSWLYFDGKKALFRQLLPDSTINIRSGGGEIGYKRMKYPVVPADSIGSIFKIDFESKKVQERLPLYNLKSFHVVADELQPVKWTIKADTKLIGKFKTTKAEADYLGRKWIVWFAPDIPMSMGPWKLYGLPGLILEAEDTGKKFKFTLKEIQVPFAKAKDMIDNVSVLDKKAMSKSEFVAFEKKKKDDQYRFTKANMTAAAGSDGGAIAINIKFPETIEIYQ